MVVRAENGIVGTGSGQVTTQHTQSVLQRV